MSDYRFVLHLILRHRVGLIGVTLRIVSFKLIAAGEGGGFFDCSTPFYFLLIEFHCTFSISNKILEYYVYHYYILIRL